MSDWPSACVGKAAANGRVAAHVADLLKVQLTGIAQQRPLKASELSELAAHFIAALEQPGAGEAA